MSRQRRAFAGTSKTFQELQLAKGNRTRLTKSSRNRPGLKTPAQRRAFEELQHRGEAPPLVALSDARPAWAKFLTDREYLFVREYCVDLCNYKAALRAGIGTNEKSAGAMASQLKRMPHVAQAIDAAIAGSEGGSVRARIVEELSAMALHNPRDYLSAKSHEDLAKLPDEAWLSIRKVKQVRGKNPSFEVEGTDKQGALDKLAKATGLYRDDKASTNVAVQVIIQQSDGALT